MQDKTKRKLHNVKAPAAAPDWFATPESHNYQLLMFEDGSTIDGVEITRAEYIALKRELARMRGHNLPKEANAA